MVEETNQKNLRNYLLVGAGALALGTLGTYALCKRSVQVEPLQVERLQVEGNYEAIKLQDWLIFVDDKNNKRLVQITKGVNPFKFSPGAKEYNADAELAKEEKVSLTARGLELKVASPTADVVEVRVKEKE